MSPNMVKIISECLSKETNDLLKNDDAVLDVSNA